MDVTSFWYNAYPKTIDAGSLYKIFVFILIFLLEKTIQKYIKYYTHYIIKNNHFNTLIFLVT